MPEPTLRDVLTAVAKLRTETTRGFWSLDAKIEKLDARVEKLDARVETIDARVETIDAKVEAHRAETEKGLAEVRTGLAELDADLTSHMRVHREIEKDIEALKRRPPRSAAGGSRRPRTR
jgi:chromosome segregation ATPase